MDLIPSDNPAVEYHISVVIVVAVVVVIALLARCYLLCRTHSDTPREIFTQEDAPWYQVAALKGCEYLWTHQGILALVVVAALITTAVLVEDLSTLFDAIREVVNYPNVVLADLNTFEPTNVACTDIVTNAKEATVAYDVPDFNEVDSFVNLMWIGIGLWASTIGIYVAAEGIERGVITCYKNSTGKDVCGSYGKRVRRLCCISGIAGGFMWLCTLIFVLALIGARTAVVIGCDYVEVPEESRYLFEEGVPDEHPFLEQLKARLADCGAPGRVTQHLEPGVLSPQLATLYNVCDNLEDQLMALVVLGTFIFPVAVLTAFLRQSREEEAPGLKASLL